MLGHPPPPPLQIPGIKPDHYIKRRTNAGLTLAHYLRCWPKMKPASGQSFVGRLRGLIYSGCGTKLRGTGFESWNESDICHRGCACAVLQTVQRPRVCSVVYGIVRYKEHVKSFDKHDKEEGI